MCLMRRLQFAVIEPESPFGSTQEMSPHSQMELNRQQRILSTLASHSKSMLVRSLVLITGCSHIRPHTTEMCFRCLRILSLDIRH